MALLFITERVELVRKALFSKTSEVVVALTYEELNQKTATERSRLFNHHWAQIIMEVTTERAAVALLTNGAWSYLVGKPVLYLRKVGIQDDMVVTGLQSRQGCVFYTMLDSADVYGAVFREFFEGSKNRPLLSILQDVFSSQMILVRYNRPAEGEAQTKPEKLLQYYGIANGERELHFIHNTLSTSIVMCGGKSRLDPGQGAVATHEPCYTIPGEKEVDGVQRKYILYLMNGEYYTTDTPKPVVEGTPAETAKTTEGTPAKTTEAAKTTESTPAKTTETTKTAETPETTPKAPEDDAPELVPAKDSAPTTVRAEACKALQVQFCVRNQLNRNVGLNLGSNVNIMLPAHTLMEGLQQPPKFWFELDKPTQFIPITEDRLADAYYWAQLKQ